MQYRLSTIFLVFFVVAASLALFKTWGIGVAGLLLIAALCVNRARTMVDGIVYAGLVIIVGLLCAGLLTPAVARSPHAASRVRCMNNMMQVGKALLDYESVHGHFPAANICDKNGKPLFAWTVEILPQLDCAYIYDRLNKDEPWDNPRNEKILAQRKINHFICPSTHQKANEYFANYAAIIGPGTIWRNDGVVSLKDLPDPSVAVMAIECAASDKHWAEPYTLTAEEALERMKTGKGMRISTAHSVVPVLFADGHVEFIPSDMPISQWRKLLMGEIKNTAELDFQSSDPNDLLPTNLSIDSPAPQTSEWRYLLSILVWLISLALLFYRAWDSRPSAKKQETSAG
jgi:prepilin-type processing-associated H-X9-DG protein